MLREANKPCGKFSDGQTLGATPLPDWASQTDLPHSDGAGVCRSFRAQPTRAALLPLRSLEYSGEGINSDFAALRVVGVFLRGSAEAY